MNKKWRQLGILALMISLLLSGCTKEVNLKTNDGFDDDSGPESGSGTLWETESNLEEEENTVPEGGTLMGIDVGEFSGDWEAPEKNGYSPFWLKYAGFKDMEEKDLTDLVFCDTFTMEMKLKDILALYSSYELYTDIEDIIIDTNQLEDILDSSDIMVDSGWYFTIKAYPDEERMQEREIKIDVYNLTDSEASAAECIQRNQFHIDFIGEEIAFANDTFGVYFEMEDFRSGFGEIMKLLGRPSRVYSGYYWNDGTERENNGKSVEDILDEGRRNPSPAIHKEFVKVLLEGGGEIYYSLVYEKAAAVFVIEVDEESYQENRYYGFSEMEYWSTKEVYDALVVEDPETLLYDFD